MKKITLELINTTCKKAQQSERKRMNHNFHEAMDDQVQRMLNALEPDTYVQPHKHESPDKREVFLILTGRILVVTFDDTGEVEDHFVLDKKIGSFGVEIPERTWHTVLALEPNSVVYEVKDGPYSPLSDKNFALWAPPENTPECALYNQNLLQKLKLK